MGIVEKLQNIITSKLNLRDKINSKISDTSKQIPSNAKLDEYCDYLDNIESEDFLIKNGSYLCADKDNRYTELKKNLLKKCKIETSNNSNYTFSVKNMFYEASVIDVEDYIPYFISVYDLSNTTSYYTSLPKEKISYLDCYYMFNKSYDYNTINLKITKDLIVNGSYMFQESKFNKITSLDDEIWVVNAGYMFSYNKNLEEVCTINLERAYNLHCIFSNCNKIKNINFKGRLLSEECTNDTLSVTGINSTTTFSCGYVFNNCTSLESVIGLDVTNVPSIANTNYMFNNTTNLKTIDWSNCEDFKISINLKTTALDRDSLMLMLDTMPTSTSNPTITISSNLLSSLTDEDIAAFSIKNYTLTS